MLPKEEYLDVVLDLLDPYQNSIQPRKRNDPQW